MEHISLKLDKSLAKEIAEKIREFHYSTKTEFIREAIREKLSKLDEERRKEKAWAALFAARGKFKGKGRFKTDKEFYEWRKNEGSRELLEYLEDKSGVNQKRLLQEA